MNILPINTVTIVGNLKRVPWSSILMTKKSESFQDQKDSEKDSGYRFWNGYKRISLYV